MHYKQLREYQDIKTLNIETTILNQLSVSGYAPKIIEMGEYKYESLEPEILKVGLEENIINRFAHTTLKRIFYLKRSQ